MSLKSHLALLLNDGLFKPAAKAALPTTSAWATGEGWSFSSDSGWRPLAASSHQVSVLLFVKENNDTSLHEAFYELDTAPIKHL